MTNQEDLLSEILSGPQCVLKSRFDSTPRKFVPEGKLDHVINRNSILAQMDVEKPSMEDESLVKFILAEAKKIFAISISIGLDETPLKKAMLLCEAKGFNDRRLLVSNTESVDSLQLPQILASLEASESTGRRIWTGKRIGDFCDEQWKFQAAVFSTANSNHDLPPYSILPFTVKHTFDKGSFGQVNKIKIHPAHFVDPLNPGQICPEFFAIKRMEPGETHDHQKVAKNWEKEVKALKKMNQLNQTHIVRFITAFRRRQTDQEDRRDNGQWSDHCLMFEWADGGNLRNLWKKHSHPKLSESLLKDTVKQLFGLAGALCAAHNLNRTGASYRHGDLKPENILWFPDNSEIGILKIGDWGVAKEHNVVTEMRPSKTTAEYGTRRYESPEVETGVRSSFLGQATKRRSRLYDIWAIGCITLEWIVWLLYGIDELQRFNRNVRGEQSDSSPFYQLTVENGKKVARVHDVATEWINHMAKDPRCQVGTTALGDLLEVVRKNLLVVRLPRRMGSTLGIMGSQRPPATSTSIQLSSDDSISLPPTDPQEPPVESNHTIPTFEFTPATNTPATDTPAAELERIPVQPEPEPEGPARALSTEFYKRLDYILVEDDIENYWFTNALGLPAPGGPDDGSSHTSAQDRSEYTTEFRTDRTQTSRLSRAAQSTSNGLAAPEPDKVDYAHPKLDNEWEHHVDKDFAMNLFSTFKRSSSFEVPKPRDSSRLCSQCQALRDDLWSPGFSVTYDLPSLRARANLKECALCGLFWRTCERHGGTIYPTVQFGRDEFSLTINNGQHPVLSIFRTPDLKTAIDNSIPIGFAELPEAGKHTHLEVIRQWLNNCDGKHNHSTYHPAKQGDKSQDESPKRLPTRLINVGKTGDKKVRLWETGTKDKGEWVALSYQWGAPPHFDTNRSNLEDHIKGMDFQTLPATFKDAVIVTRGLGRRYLWIDSICIVQGKGGDFNQEARRMEDVYSGAYCVIAASRATGHYSGFLQARNKRDYVALRCEHEAPFIIGQTIDDFNAHVSEGALNRRGWVMQEHALARRSIFFTEYQTYWECGDGVRCETMTKMKNNLAALLGDSDFPQIVENAPQGEKILRYQDFYKKYSQLSLSNPYDRPMAIDGLQRRLLRTMKAEGGFGVFDEKGNKGFLRRSLLWHRLLQDAEGRPVSATLSRIKFPADHAISVVPSWSWMAYTGAIDFFKLDFSGFEWEEIQPPWSRSASNGLQSDGRGEPVALTVVVRGFDPNAAVAGEGMLVLDNPGGSEQPKTMCVVLGIEKNVPKKKAKHTGDKIHFMLIVTPTGGLDRDGNKRYERVGAGYLPGKCIGPPGDTVTIH